MSGKYDSNYKYKINIINITDYGNIEFKMTFYKKKLYVYDENKDEYKL